MNYSITKNPKDRFWKYTPQSEGCWEWTGPRHHRGAYGMLWLARGKPVAAHRFSWEIHHGPIPDGMYVCHKCDNPPCVNPGHLFLGSPKDNTHDALRKGRLSKPPRVESKGEANGQAKLTEDQVLEIRSRYGRGGHTYLSLANDYGVSHQLVHLIIKRLRWRHV